MAANYKRKRVKLKSDPDFLPLNYAEIFEVEEVKELKYGMDFRLPIYRREVFLRFYEFHLKYRSHPGCVYYLFPYLSEKLNMTKEQEYWFAFINGCTQNPCTTYVLFNLFPDLEKIDIDKLEYWHSKNWKRLDYDTDKRYSKGHFVENVQNYLEQLDGLNQVQFFEEGYCFKEDPNDNFMPLWEKVNKDFYLFGRLSTFSYLEYLRIFGLNIDCPDLFFDDLSGSKSHRNGICKILGRDDLDWYKDNPEITFHPKELVEWVEVEAERLLAEAKERFKGRDFYNDVSYFTLESAFCTFKSHFRVNRRYPNVYNDLLFKRIKKAEKSGWEDHGIDFNIFWEARKKTQRKELLLEFNLNDPSHDQEGLSKEKQNHFRLTGEMPMMNIEEDCFKNKFNDKYY